MRYFGRTASRGWAVKTSYGVLPPTPTEEEKLILISKLRSGCKDARRELILGHLRFGILLVGRYAASLRANTDVIDELLGITEAAIVEGVDLFVKNTDHQYLTQYLKQTIHSRISAYLEERPLVAMPGRTRRRHRAEGKDTSFVPDRTRSIRGVHEGEYDTTLSDLEIKEVLDRLCESELERNILELRLENKNDREIGEQLGIHRKTVNIIRQDLQDRYNSRFGACHGNQRMDRQV